METDERRLRPKGQITYEISSGSEDELAKSESGSPFTSPDHPSKRRFSIVDLMEEDESEQEKGPPQPRLSAAGHSLRQPTEINLSLRAQENGDRPRKKRRMLFTAPQSMKPARNQQRLHKHKPETERNRVRAHIALETARKRTNFLLAHKEYFLPLLPKQNHVQDLIDRKYGDPTKAESIPFEMLEQQPAGVIATMKPYQLRGLSFLVHMYRNAFSAILGDEMGLGKTLQTLSLLQFIKENEERISSEPRPSLVVCPLSVLSSWMGEAAKWTPKLKVLRLHGPVQERNRLKRMATGDIDRFGNETRFARMKRNNRQTARGKTVIDLDSEDDPLQGQGHKQGGYDIILTTYEGFLAEQSWFKSAFAWKYVILDEGHKIKSDLTLISKALQGLGAEHRLILTGTPLQNNLQELWALLHWLFPDVFTERTSELFKTSFNLTKGQVDTDTMAHARQLLEIVMLRRMKNSPGVNLGLPPKTEVLLYAPLTPMQKFWYLRLLTRADQGLLDSIFKGAADKEATSLEETKAQDETFASLEKLEKEAEAGSEEAMTKWQESKNIMVQAMEREKEDQSKSTAWRKLMNIVMQLRKCCNHPYTLPNAGPDPYYIGEHIIHASAKFIILDKILSELVVKQKRKILIFSGFTRLLDCAEDLLALRGDYGRKFKYTRLDGSTCRARRNLGIRMFNKEGTEYRVMLISTRAGGLGINLATASDLVMMDQDWNPQVMLQAEARSHRIGQTKPVTVYKLCTQGTVEEQMMGRIQKKLYLSAKVTETMRDLHFSETPKENKRDSMPGEKGADGEMPQLGTNELISLVRRGAQTLAHPELDVNEMLSWDWNTMLQRCKDQPADVSVAKDSGSKHSSKEEEEDEKTWLAQAEQVQSRVFEGKKHKKSALENNSTIAQEWSRESRRVGKNTTVMIDGYTVSKESVGCGEWEAVATLAGKDPRLAEPTREKKAAVVNQDHCQICWQGGKLILCTLCPRSYHYDCVDHDTKSRSKSKMNFSCPQHECVECSQKTTDAGGMLYRCRWCERAFCEDCLNFEKTDLLGETLKEYELLGFPAVAQAFYIKCHACADDHIVNPGDRKVCDDWAAEIDEQYGVLLNEQSDELEDLTATPSLVGDSTTLDGSGIITPPDGDEIKQDSPVPQKGGRKENLRIVKTSPTTRSQGLQTRGSTTKS